MLAVVRLSDEAYGAAIRDELRHVAGRTASVQTVWVTLVRLEEQGLTASTEVAAPEGGRPRRIFRITPQGRRTRKSVANAVSRVEGEPGATWWRVLPDGALLAIGYKLNISPGTWAATHAVRLVSAQGSVTSLGDYTGTEQIRAPGTGWMVFHSFTPYPHSSVRARPFAALVVRIVTILQ